MQYEISKRRKHRGEKERIHHEHDRNVHVPHVHVNPHAFFQCASVMLTNPFQQLINGKLIESFPFFIQTVKGEKLWMLIILKGSDECVERRIRYKLI